MFVVKAGSVITEELIEKAIKYNEKLLPRYTRLYNYYNGVHDILKRTKTSDILANNKTVTNFPELITDTNVSYLLGKAVDYVIEEEKSKSYDIDLIKEEYKEQTIADHDTDLGDHASEVGIAYERVYADGNDVRSVRVPAQHCVIAYDDTVKHDKVFAVIYEKSPNADDKYLKVEVLDKVQVTTWADYAWGGNLSQGKVIPHNFGLVPVVPFFNKNARAKDDQKLKGDFESILSLVDAYNVLQSDRVNDKEQLVNALLVLYGFSIEKEQLKSVKEDRVLSKVPPEGKAEYLVKQLNEVQLDVLRKNLSEDIHKIAKTPNFSDENFGQNASGVAMAFKLWSFEQNANKKERAFEAALLDRFVLYNNYFNKLKGMKIVPIHKIKVVFKRSMPRNDLEMAQVINLLADHLPLEMLIGQLSFVSNAKAALEQKKKELEDEGDGGDGLKTNFGDNAPAEQTAAGQGNAPAKEQAK